VEDGAVLKGGIQVKSAENNRQTQPQAKAVEAPKPPAEPPKALTAIAGA
jgi:hypothetical protein